MEEAIRGWPERRMKQVDFVTAQSNLHTSVNKSSHDSGRKHQDASANPCDSFSDSLVLQVDKADPPPHFRSGDFALKARKHGMGGLQISAAHLSAETLVITGFQSPR